MNKYDDFIYLIYTYKKLLNKEHNIIKYLTEHTELFETKYMDDFPAELYRFFTGKLAKRANEINKLYELLSEEQLKKLRKIEILED